MLPDAPCLTWQCPFLSYQVSCSPGEPWPGGSQVWPCQSGETVEATEATFLLTDPGENRAARFHRTSGKKGRWEVVKPKSPLLGSRVLAEQVSLGNSNGWV